jgi:hypothetical protein
LRGGLEAHAQVALTDEELDRIVTWVDMNAPFYPRYDCAYPHNLAGRSPLTDGQTSRLAELTGVPFHELASHHGNRGPQVSFDRPELSPCLAPLKDTKQAQHTEALAIIRAGAAMLRERPRADMPGFVPCAENLRRDRAYDDRRRIEERNRAALIAGRKSYEGPDGD